LIDQNYILNKYKNLQHQNLNKKNCKGKRSNNDNCHFIESNLKKIEKRPISKEKNHNNMIFLECCQII